ncbi:MAG: DUF3568 family protein [Planctomycetes bacterium]|nr:DUF3568 family protein [Planctomycetota bacterium]
MSIQRMCTICVLAGLMLAVCGCGRPNLIGTDAAVYSRGKLYAVAGQDMNRVYLATQKALKQLELEVIEQAKDVFIAKIVAKAADGKKITIWIEPISGDSSELSIKTGKLVGNEERSRVIYEKIRQNLGTGSGK